MNNMLTSSAIEMSPPGTSEQEAGPAEAPVRGTRRLPTLDLLRGLALLGILLLNIEDFAGPESLWDIPVGLPRPAFTGWHTGLDYAILTLTWMFAEGKMRSMFAMLFGAGVVLLTERLEKRSDPVRARTIYFRRNLWLLVFGLCHGFILWFGDILVDYSTMGLIFLYPLRRLSARALLILGLNLWLIGGTFGSTRALNVPETLRAEAKLNAARAAGVSATAAQRTLLQSTLKETNAAAVQETLRARRLGFVAGWPDRVGTELNILKLKFATFWILEWLGAMITGMGLYKSGFLTNKHPIHTYVRLALAGYAIALPVILVGLWQVNRAGFAPAAFARWMAIPYTAQVTAGTLANISILLLLVRSRCLGSIVDQVAVVGRMAFSNYIFTTILCQFLFAWGPWKLYGKLEYYQWYIVMTAIWALNLITSSLWLRVFAFGPLEWLWRSLSYWKLQPMLFETKYNESSLASTPEPAGNNKRYR
jgi:uncharacterized protein